MNIPTNLDILIAGVTGEENRRKEQYQKFQNALESGQGKITFLNVAACYNCKCPLAWDIIDCKCTCHTECEDCI